MFWPNIEQPQTKWTHKTFTFFSFHIYRFIHSNIVIFFCRNQKTKPEKNLPKIFLLSWWWWSSAAKPKWTKFQIFFTMFVVEYIKIEEENKLRLLFNDFDGRNSCCSLLVFFLWRPTTPFWTHTQVQMLFFFAVKFLVVVVVEKHFVY